MWQVYVFFRKLNCFLSLSHSWMYVLKGNCCILSIDIWFFNIYWLVFVTLNLEVLYVLKLCPIFVGPTMCFRWQNQANFVPPSYKLHNPHHPNPIRWLCQFTGTLNDFFNFSINFFFLQMTKKTISVINWMRWLKIWANLQNKRRMIKWNAK